MGWGRGRGQRGPGGRGEADTHLASQMQPVGREFVYPKTLSSPKASGVFVGSYEQNWKEGFTRPWGGSPGGCGEVEGVGSRGGVRLIWFMAGQGNGPDRPRHNPTPPPSASPHPDPAPSPSLHPLQRHPTQTPNPSASPHPLQPHPTPTPAPLPPSPTHTDPSPQPLFQPHRLQTHRPKVRHPLT